MKKYAKILAILLVLSLILSFAAVVINAATAEADGSTPDAESIMKQALVMKTGSNNALSKGDKITLFLDGEDNPTGAPYVSESGVMVPLLPIIKYTETPYTVSGAGTYNLTVSGNTVTVEAGNSATVGTVITLTAAPVLKTFNDISVLYVALNDVESIFDGFYVTYDASGLIYVSEYDEFVNRNDDETLMREVAEEFIYTDIDFRNIVGKDGSVIIGYIAKYGELPFGSVSDVKQAYPTKYTGTYKEITDAIVNNFKDTSEMGELYSMFSSGTDEFQHPYIKTTQSRFDMLNETYLAANGGGEYDEELFSYIEEQIAYADKYFERYAFINEEGEVVLRQGQWGYDSEGKTNESMKPDGGGIGWDTTQETGNHDVSKMPYTDSGDITTAGYGYDPAGGRLNVLSNGEHCLVAALEPTALAYQITRDEKYLDFAYLWMSALCSWEHWGPGHFLNCANTARPLATAYDWLYNDFVRVNGQAAVDALAARIYENAVYEAQISLAGLTPEHTRISGDSSRYHQHIGNWNSVCTLGMLTASLAIMNECDGAYKDEALYVIAASLGHYMERGFTYISLDGGYLESAGYWGSVNNMHFITKILMDTAGTDFGFLDVPGIEITDYFGYQLEGSDYTRWNYHDDWVGTQPSWWYYLSADLYDNPEYAAIRYQQIHSGDNDKAPHRYDLLYYDKEKVDAIKDYKVDLTLDYSMTSIDATIVRDAYEKNSLFAGVMGGKNNVAHGQYDSGNWIYENEGVRWFVDLGADNYNLYNGGLKTGYYKYSAEGNNTLALTSDHELLPHGQGLEEGGEIVSFVSNPYGSATVIDQNAVYLGKTEYARRGMFLTNNRNTFVIQDEVKSINPETFYWFGHYDTKKIFEIEIAEDGKVAYMVAPNADGEFITLRVSLVSDNESLKFEIMDTHTFTLNTPSSDYSPNNNGIYEDVRDNFMKLAVKAENVTELNMAVVIEVVGNMSSFKSGYTKLVPMSEWAPEKGDGEVSQEGRTVYTVYYDDGTTKNFTTSRLIDAILDTDGVNVKREVERIDCFGNVSLSSTVNIRDGEHLVIDLNGNMLYQTNLIRLGNTSATHTGSLTVKDGTWYSESYLQIRSGSTFRMNGVDYSSTSSLFIRDEGARMIFDASEVSVRDRLIQVTNNAHTTAESGHALIINNSEVRVGGTLLTFYEGHADYKNYLDVCVMGNSSLSIDGYMTKDSETGSVSYDTGKLVNYVLNSTDVRINFHAGEGVKLAFCGFVLPEDEVSETVNRTYSVSYRRDFGMDGGNIVWGNELLEAEDGVLGYSDYTYLIEEGADADFPYTVLKNDGVFFEAYLEGGSKLCYYTEEIADALPTDYVDNGVRRIVLLCDAKLTKTANLGDAQTLSLELGEFTLKIISGRITMGDSSGASSCYVTVIGDGGKIVKTSGDGFCARLGTTLILNDVEIESENHVLWDNGAENIVFNGCTVTTKGNLIYSRYGTLVNNDGAYSHTVVFNDTSVTVNNALLHYQEMKDVAFTTVDVYAIGETKLSYPKLYNYADNASVTKAEHNLHAEQGVLFSAADLGFGVGSDARVNNLSGYASVAFDGVSIGKCVKFPTVKITENGGFYEVTLVSMVTGVKSSLTLYSDFTVNFYIPKEGNVIDLVMINGETVYIHDKTETYTENGVTYYKVSVRNILPHYAADDIEIVFSCCGFEEHKTFSVIKYCESLFKNGRFANNYPLAASVISYIDAAYSYAGREKPESLTNIMATGVCRANTPEPMPYAESTADSGNIVIALRGAQLDLSVSLKFRFNLQTDFTGTLNIGGRSYDVVNGYTEGLNYVLFEMRAYDMFDAEKYITISGVRTSDGMEFSGTYDLREYIENTDLSEEKLSNLISTLYTYCTEAYSMKYGIPQERPDKGDTPQIDAGI